MTKASNVPPLGACSMIFPDVLPLVNVSFEAADLIDAWLELQQAAPIATVVLEQDCLLVSTREDPDSGILLEPEDWCWRPEVVN